MEIETTLIKGAKNMYVSLLSSYPFSNSFLIFVLTTEALGMKSTQLTLSGFDGLFVN